MSECIDKVECFFAYVGESGLFVPGSLCLVLSCRTVGVLLL